MTDIKLLELLIDYYDAQAQVASSMFWAMEDFGDGDIEASWLHLFGWCEDKDHRAELWSKFKHDYPRAMMLKEGYYP